MVEHPLLSIQKEVDHSLWKTCFYKQIESYRQTLKKLALLSSTSKKPREHSNRSDNQTSVLLMQTSMEFETYLSQAESFYILLMRELEDKALLVSTLEPHFQRCIHSCLLYLGDIARYQQLSNEIKNWTIAQRYYERASFLCPHLGSSYNQLAVLASYEQADCVAVYYYSRCLLLSIFPSLQSTSQDEQDHQQRPDITRARDNLIILFAKNKTEFNDLDLSAVARARHMAAREGDKKLRVQRVSTFLVVFVRLQSIFFAPQLNKEGTKEKSVSGDVFEFISKVAPVILGEYDSLLQASAFSELLLLRMLIICIASVHLCRDKEAASGERTILESFALTMFFQWIKM